MNAKDMIGKLVSEDEMVDLIRSQPIGTSENDVRVRSGVLSFTFGPSGVRLIDAEERKPLGSPAPCKDSGGAG